MSFLLIWFPIPHYSIFTIITPEIFYRIIIIKIHFDPTQWTSVCGQASLTLAF